MAVIGMACKYSIQERPRVCSDANSLPRCQVPPRRSGNSDTGRTESCRNNALTPEGVMSENFDLVDSAR